MTDNFTLHDRTGRGRNGDEPTAANMAFVTTSEPTEPPPAPPDDARPRSPGGRRPGRRVAAGATVLALMFGAGAVGGWAATSWNDTSTATSTATTETAPSGGQQTAQENLAAIVAAVQPSVVSIRTGTGEGSGVVLDTNGHILTNNHVAATAAGNTVTVTFSDGTSAKATVVGTDPRSDLAVVKVDDGSHLTPAKFADSDAVQVGDEVLALGSPLGLEGSVTSGIISAKNRTIQESGQQGPLATSATSISGLLQTDAAINPGNSGGALVDTAGQVVGINTAIATTGQNSGNIGVGFAIPSKTAKSVAEQLINGQQVAHPLLGVGVADTSDAAGALIQSVEPGSAAAAAGLQAGDLVTAIDGRTVNNADDLISAVQASSVGKQITITYTRSGGEHTATATLGEAQ